MRNNFYNQFASEFIKDTIDVDMSLTYNKFERYLQKGDKVLDIGFGSGRDSLYFLKKYETVSIDTSAEFVKHGKTILDNVELLDVRNIEYNNEFNGIWACASLLHIPSNDLIDVLKKCYIALRDKGVMYVSFKYGDFEGERNNRYFLDMTESKFNQYIDKTDFTLIEYFVTEDRRTNRNGKWLNVLLLKENNENIK